MPHFVGKQIELTIDRLSYDGGRGVGRSDNLVFFVPKTAPGDKILATVTVIKKNYAEAELNKILKPSMFRREAPCPVADQCGGCVWQRIVYEEQVRQKKALLTYNLRNFLPENLKNIEVIPAENEFRYRNRVQVHTRKLPDGKKYFGFFQTGSNELVPITDCLISDARLFEDLNVDHLGEKKTEIGLDENNKRVIRDLAHTPSEFTQVNTAQNKVLQDCVLGLVKKNITNSIETIYDLYCGAGNLTFPIFNFAKKIKMIGVEENSAAIAKARTKAQSSAMGEIHFISEDVSLFLEKTKQIAPSIFIVDPPRAGLGSKVVQNILRLKPLTVVYVSCNLSTLARDLKQLCHNTAGPRYQLRSAVGLDMFPQTEHIETVVELHMLLDS